MGGVLPASGLPPCVIWSEGLSMIGKLGLPELLVILFIALLIFGPKKLGDLGKGLGEGIRSFKSGLSGGAESSSQGCGS